MCARGSPPRGRALGTRGGSPTRSAPSTSSPNARTSCSSGRPAPTVTYLAVGLSIRACEAGHRLAFATAAQWVDRHGWPLHVIDGAAHVPHIEQPDTFVEALTTVDATA